MAELNLIDQSKYIRRRIVELAYNAGKNGAHIGGSMSVVEILVSLYSFITTYKGEKRDRIILSKGHAALALYSLLEYHNILTKDETDTFETNGTHFYAHAPRNIEKGIEFSGGSLSLGLSFAIGVAISCKKHQYDNRIYAIVGDGECDEGLIWESIMSASNFKLNNFTIIVDCNEVQLDGRTNEIMNLENLAKKFESFGFLTIEVNGHSTQEIITALSISSDKPKAIIAHTIKGKGLSFAEGSSLWHHNTITEDLLAQALSELK